MSVNSKMRFKMKIFQNSVIENSDAIRMNKISAIMKQQSGAGKNSVLDMRQN